MTSRPAAANALLLDLAAARASAALRDAGIRAILLKGPVIARWLYDDGSERNYGDVDLLVAPHITLDFRHPKFSVLSKFQSSLLFPAVTVPEMAVAKHGHFGSRKREIGFTNDWILLPITESCSPHS